MIRLPFHVPTAYGLFFAGACVLACSCQPAQPVNATSASPAPKGTLARLDKDACEHFSEGPASAVVATASPTAGPLVSKAHTRFDITLPNDGSVVTVRYASGKVGDVVFYLDKAVPMTIADESRRVLPVTSAANASGDCGTVRSRQQVTLGVGVHTVSIGPTSEKSVSLVAIAADDPGDK